MVADKVMEKVLTTHARRLTRRVTLEARHKQIEALMLCAALEFS